MSVSQSSTATHPRRLHESGQVLDGEALVIGQPVASAARMLPATPILIVSPDRCAVVALVGVRTDV